MAEIAAAPETHHMTLHFQLHTVIQLVVSTEVVVL
jgi:hypothetical protein